jgi:hypothetical protein
LATYNGIAAVSKAIIGLLADARRDQFPTELPVPDFRLFHASDYDNPTNSTDARGLSNGFGVSLFLYRVAINGTMRNAPRQHKADGQVYRAPLPLDLFYLLTPWANDVETQQRLLGWCMRVLHDTPILPAALINAHTADVDTFHPGETVELTLDQLSFQDITTLWDKLKPKMQSSVVYIARMVVLESASALVQAGPVQTRVFDQIASNGTSG